MIVFADLHLKEATEDTCFKVLAAVKRLAFADPDRRVIFCGDFWQLRYQVNVRLLNRVKAELHNWAATGLRIDLVPGNHDQVTIAGTNALEVLGEDNIHVWTEPGTSGDGLAFCPYRKDREAQLAALKTSAAPGKTRIVFGHFALRGAVMNSAKTDEDGLVLPWIGNEARGYPLLILGHYHKHQTIASGQPGFLYACYAGSPYQQSFGEADNAAGVLQVDSRRNVTQIPLDVGPRYFIVRWDVEQSAEPPAPPSSRAADKIRLDIAAAYSSLANPELMAKVAKAGYVSAGAQVNVLPRDVAREHKFALVAGESLAQAAERFVRERCPEGAEAEKRLEYLRRWAAEEVGR